MRSSTLLNLLALICASSLLIATAVNGASISGRVTSLTGEGERALTMRAIDTKTKVAVDVVTDASGAYSFPSLAAAVYSVAPVIEAAKEGDSSSAPSPSSSSRFSRASPSSNTIDLTSTSDAKLPAFIIFRRPSKSDITGTIVGIASQHLPTLEVVATSQHNGQVVAKANVLPGTTYFELLNLPVGEIYDITLRSSINTRTHTFTSTSQTISLKSAAVHITLDGAIAYKMSSVVEMQQNSFFQTLLIVLVVLGFIYKDISILLIRGVVKSVYVRNINPLRTAISNVISSSGSASSNLEDKVSSSSSTSSSTAGSNKSKPVGSSSKSGYVKKEKTHVSTFVRYDSLPQSAAPLNDAPATTPTAASTSSFSRQAAPVAAPAPIVKEQTPSPPPAAVAPSSSPSASSTTPKHEKKKVSISTAPPMVQEAPAPIPKEKKEKNKKAKDVAAALVAAPTAVVTPKASVSTSVTTPVVAPSPVAASTPSSAAKFCPSCGHKREDINGKFCSECGHKF